MAETTKSESTKYRLRPDASPCSFIPQFSRAKNAPKTGLKSGPKTRQSPLNCHPVPDGADRGEARVVGRPSLRDHLEPVNVINRGFSTAITFR